jgi:UV DNA damage endonuclease
MVNLGLVCLTSPACSTRIAYRTLRRASVSIAALVPIYLANIATLRAALTYCTTVLRTRLYRMPCGLLPWLDSDGATGDAAREAFAVAAPHLRAAMAEFPDMRVTCHPDQFCVLSSDRSDVVAASVRMLEAESLVMDTLGLPRSPWAGINIHGGKGDRLAQLRRAVDALSEAVRSRLTLENDERAYSVPDLCSVGVPVVFDAHHETVRSRCAINAPHLQEHAALALRTWPCPSLALAHLSNGATGIHDRRHSDLIGYAFPALRDYGWIDVEAKGKEWAVAALTTRG